MKALALTDKKTLQMVDIQPPQPKADEILLRVKRAGICGSDLHFYDTGILGDGPLREPFVMGHEFMGVVADSCGVEGAPPAGTRVAVDPAVPCGSCEFCQAGGGNICPHVKFTGYPPHTGAYTETLAIPAENVFPLPDSITDEEGPLIETLAVALHALEIMPEVRGKRCAVIGAGSVGMLVLLLLKHYGADVVLVTEPVDERRKMADSVSGAFVAHPDEKAAITDHLKRETGYGPELVFEAAGEPDGFQTALDIVRPGGEVCFIGIYPYGVIPLDYRSMRRKEIRLIYCRRSLLKNYPEAIRLVADDHVNIKPLLTHQFPLEEGAEAFSMASQRRDGILKGILQID